jgi:hypothetical protein
MHRRYLGIRAVSATVATGAMMSPLFAQSNDGAEAARTPRPAHAAGAG